MRKGERRLILSFLAPAIILYVIIFAYPIIRTVIMSFFYIPMVVSPTAVWEPVGFENFTQLFSSLYFRMGLRNIFIIWLFGGVFILCIAMYFAIILQLGARFKSFWRAAIYLPQVIPAVAMAYIWLQYIYAQRYGLLVNLFNYLQMHKMAEFPFTSPENIFYSMVFAYAFCSIGYYMIVMLAGLDSIPKDYYEVAKIEGANAWQTFWKVSLPLLKPVLRNCFIIYSTAAINFFVWVEMFSGPNNTNFMLATPVSYMYIMLFGQNLVVVDPRQVNAGVAAAVGIVVTTLVVIVYMVINTLVREEKASDRIEY